MKLRVAYTVELTSEQSELLAKLADQVGIVADSQRDLLKRLFVEYGRGCLGMEVDGYTGYASYEFEDREA